MSQPITQHETNTIVWRACDTFRGTVDPTYYSGLLLIKFAQRVHSDDYSVRGAGE